MAFPLRKLFGELLGAQTRFPDKRVVVSSLFYHREDIATEFCRRLVPQLTFLREELGCEIHLVISLNYPFTASLWDEIEATLRPMFSAGIEFSIVRRGWNAGFGAGHNAVFADFLSDVFVALNNDIVCDNNHWLADLCRPLLEPDGPDVFGASENRTSLRASDGCGIPPAHGLVHDFVDGSILALRSTTVRRLGLFSPAMRYCYFEDSDLVLRYRQAGAKIKDVSVPHQHLRHGSSTQLPREVLRELLDQNRDVFMKRWGDYLRGRRNFIGRVGVDLNQLRAEELLDVWPALIALGAAHAGTPLAVALKTHSSSAMPPIPGADFSDKLPREVDRVWTPAPRSIEDPLPPVLSFLKEVGAGREMLPKVRDHLLAWLQTDDGFNTAMDNAVLIAAGDKNRARPGVDFPEALTDSIRAQLEHAGQAFFVADGLTDLRRLAAQVNGASRVITAAGPVSTLAQLLGKRVLVICGASMPARAIWEWNTSRAWIDTSLSCRGCQSRWGNGAKTYCLRGDLACLSSTHACEIVKHLLLFESSTDELSGAALQLIQDQLLLSRFSSPELDLSRWREI